MDVWNNDNGNVTEVIFFVYITIWIKDIGQRTVKSTSEAYTSQTCFT